jgi:uncharacterized membrane protein YecN with MAPEG domain
MKLQSLSAPNVQQGSIPRQWLPRTMHRVFHAAQGRIPALKALTQTIRALCAVPEHIQMKVLLFFAMLAQKDPTRIFLVLAILVFVSHAWPVSTGRRMVPHHV